MRRTRLVNHIKGSFLKEQYLEAFLVQSAYIEGLLKMFSDFSFWQETREKLESGSKLVEELRKRVKHLNLYEIIEFLFKSSLIDLSQKKNLHTYREKRNNVLHDLVSQMSNEVFEKELKEICELGDKIIEDSKFKRMEDVIDRIEKRKMEKSPVQPSSGVQVLTDALAPSNVDEIKQNGTPR